MIRPTPSSSAIELSPTVEPPLDAALLNPTLRKLPIRQHLEEWERKFGGPGDEVLSAFENHPAHGDIQNRIAKLSFSSKADEDPGEEEQMPSEDDEGEELITIGLFLKPGDVVELAQPGREPVLAVFVQQLDLLSQFYSVNGRWCHSSLKSISFAVPGAIDPALLKPLVPYLPTKPGEVQSKEPVYVPRELGAPVQALLHQLTEDSERIYRNNAPVLDTAYSTLADTTRTRMMTLPQIAKTLLGKSDPAWTPSPAALVAVRKALKHNEFRFRSDARSQRLTNVFAIRPKHDVEVVETVHEWVREYREHEAARVSCDHSKQRMRSAGAKNIRDFVTKAQRLIAESRERRQPNPGFVGPDKIRTLSTEPSSGLQAAVWGEEFNEADQQIISFLQAWALTYQFPFMPNLHSACTSILHAIECYNDLDAKYLKPTDMGVAAGLLFLQEIGVITPFENRSIYNEGLMLPTVRLSRNLELLNTKAELTRRNPDFRDTMADLRRDWGSVTVYCIDSFGAKEIDDGVSIERVPGKPSEYWIHVHVANPTAFFDKTHVLSGLAAHMTETVYTPESTFPMLPSWATQNYFSLGNNRPVITFSSRIDDSGNILESKIQHGIIRKVVSITPAEMSTYLGEQTTESFVRLVVGGEPSAKHKGRLLPRLSADQLQDLRDLYSAAQCLWKGRKAAGAVRIGFDAKVEASVYEKPHVEGLTWMPPSVDRVRRVIGDPIIELRSMTSKEGGHLSDNIDSTNIVEEMMLLACRTAGTWCAERNIPVMFRGTVQSPSQALSLTQFREQILLPHLEKNGSMSMSVGQLYMQALGRAIAHSSPLPHNILGAKSYVKVTSPLRRFSDMIAHWQIEAAIRFEARTGQKLNAKLLMDAPRAILPFSQRQMQESIITLSPREKLISSTKKLSTDFWVLQAFMRAFYYKEAALPDTFNMRVKWIYDHGRATGFLEDWATRVSLIPNPGLQYQTGDRWEVKIREIDVFKLDIRVEPIRMIGRDEPM
ncbi:3'-5' RNA exonuclease complex component [Kalmusia sp. IMI 367209]|nr:3'-5' RNA exonuclease complex component [Kalmusia sp. IMI 367209]